MKIKQLAKRIRAEVMPDEDGELYYLIHREWVRESARGLRRTTLDELELLHGRVSRAIPQDFDFMIAFEDGHVLAQLTYSDGRRTMAGGPFPVSIDDRVVENLRKVDWEAERLAAIEQNNLHDDIADRAEDMLPIWHTTKALQDAYDSEVKEYVRWLQEVGQPSGVLAASIDDRTLMNCKFDTDEEMNQWLSTRMGQGDLILAIVQSGLLLPAEQTEALKLAELEKLPRVARAKAEGRFQQAFSEFVS